MAFGQDDWAGMLCNNFLEANYWDGMVADGWR